MANNVKAWQPSACFAGFVVMLWLSTPPAFRQFKQSGLSGLVPSSVANSANAGKPSQPLPNKEALIQGYKACFSETTPPPAITELDLQKFNNLVFDCTEAKKQNRQMSKPMRDLLNDGWKACYGQNTRSIRTNDQGMAELIEDCARKRGWLK